MIYLKIIKKLIFIINNNIKQKMYLINNTYYKIDEKEIDEIGIVRNYDDKNKDIKEIEVFPNCYNF